MKLFESINKFREDPGSLGDYLYNEIKNISIQKKNDKEIFIYKGIYSLSGKEELFIQVSNTLKTLDSYNPLEFSQDLYILPAEKILKKNASVEEKEKALKEKQLEDKNNFKKIKLNLANKFHKIKIFRHNMINNDIDDSIIMQILTNFNYENNTKERFFDYIFSNEIKFIGISLSGKKAKKEGYILLA